MKQPTINAISERIINYGIDYLSDTEALAALTGIPVRKLEQMIKQYNFHGLIRYAHLLEITSQQKTRLELVYNICQRIGKAEYQPGILITTPADIGKLFVSELQFESIEVVILAFLDTRSRLIRYEKVCSGTTNAAVIYRKDVVRKALIWNAVSVIIGHNHPSGNLTPSHDDIQMTHELAKSLSSVELKLADHILVANNSYISFKEELIF